VGCNCWLGVFLFIIEVQALWRMNEDEDGVSLALFRQKASWWLPRVSAFVEKDERLKMISGTM